MSDDDAPELTHYQRGGQTRTVVTRDLELMPGLKDTLAYRGWKKIPAAKAAQIEKAAAAETER